MNAKFYRTPAFRKVGMPGILMLITIILGAFATGEPVFSCGFWGGLWHSFSYLAGEETFLHPADLLENDLFSKKGLYFAAHVAGAIFLFYSVFVVVLQIFNENLNRFKIWRWTHFRIKKKDYVVICGLGWRGATLAKELIRKKIKVVAVDIETEGAHIEELERLGAVIYNGDATNSVLLERKAKVLGASKVYALTNDEEINCRIAVNIEQITIKHLKEKNKNDYIPSCIESGMCNETNCNKCDKKRTVCYVAVDEHSYGRSLEDIIEENNPFWASRFSINESTVLKLFREQGIAPEDGQKGTSINIFGYTPIGKTLLLMAINMMHFRKTNNERYITVYTNQPEEDEKEFYSEFPMLDIKEHSENKAVLPVIAFEELPQSDYAYLDDSLKIYVLGQAQNALRTNVYFCIDDGLQSLSAIKMMNRKLTKTCRGEQGDSKNLHIACYYSYPEQAANYRVLPHLSKQEQKNETAVRYFGKSASSEFIEATELKGIAKEVKTYYDREYVFGEKQNKLVDKNGFIEELWHRSPEWERYSNLMCASHFYVKEALLAKDEIKEICDHIQDTEKSSPKDVLLDNLMSNNLFDELAEIEHNRWWAEKLVRGFRPLTTEEAELWREDKDQKKYLKLILRHNDLKPFDELTKSVQQTDGQILRIFPEFLKKYINS